MEILFCHSLRVQHVDSKVAFRRVRTLGAVVRMGGFSRLAAIGGEDVNQHPLRAPFRGIAEAMSESVALIVVVQS